MSPLERLARVDPDRAANVRTTPDGEALDTVAAIVAVLDGGNAAAVSLAATFRGKIDADGAQGARQVLALVALAPSRLR